MVTKTKAEKKPISVLMAEIQQYRHMICKNYVHKESGENFYLMCLGHDCNTQELMAYYLANWNSQLKFNRPMSEFLEKFEEGHSAK